MLISRPVSLSTVCLFDFCINTYTKKQCYYLRKLEVPLQHGDNKPSASSHKPSCRMRICCLLLQLAAFRWHALLYDLSSSPHTGSSNSSQSVEQTHPARPFVTSQCLSSSHSSSSQLNPFPKIKKHSVATEMALIHAAVKLYASTL